MRHQIYSEDAFFREAVTELLPDREDGPQHYIIDVQSLASLEVLEVLLLCCQPDHAACVTFIGGDCFYSRVLTSLTAFDRKAPVQVYRQHLAHAVNGLCYRSALVYVRQLRQLACLTKSELHAADVLCRYPDINRAAKVMQCQPKTVYYHARMAGRKLNLRNLQEFRLFLLSEFISEQGVGYLQLSSRG